MLALCFAFALRPATAQILPSFGGDRAGTSGFQFLKVAVDARAAALGETVAANAFDASALFWNPALAAQAEGHRLGFSHAAYYAGTTLDFASALYHLPWGGLTIGASAQVFSSGAMDVTTEFEPQGTGETFSVVDLAAGLTLAQTLTDLFSYGVTAKWVHEGLAGLDINTAVVDLGFFYRVGDTGAQVAVAIRNFGLDGEPSGAIERTTVGQSQPVVEDDFESLTPPTTFLLGATYNVFRNAASKNRLMLSGQLTRPNDNAESFNLGVEYVWNDLLALRGGYRFGIEEYSVPSAGVGLNLPLAGPRLRFDYGFTRLDRLGSVHRFGIDVALR